MHTQLAAVIEGLVDAAVAELQRLEEERPVVGAREERHEAFRVQTENREKLVKTGGCAVETPFVPGVSVRDGHGNIDPGAIRESESLIHICL
ncbi:hypothetical protein XENOCAPTIV_001373 [Xenoophorus captivus]|uniref:Uncharacterized protein n=1 Tax=Xenoophorus captivus TaxID=1517983 RepID=A0ABV0R7H1_9TELE